MTNSPSQPDAPAYRGAQDFPTGNSDLNVMDFVARQIMSRMETCAVVKVLAVTVQTDGAIGTVDVQPLVAQIDGAGNPTPHGTVYALPYVRLQGGANAVIIDPAVGDVGLAVFASRDISSVKSTRAAANPGSRRMYDMADGIYIGGMLNGTPTRFVRLTNSGIEITAPDMVTIAAPQLAFMGQATFDMPPMVPDVNVAGHLYSLHKHQVVAVGAPTGPVLPV